MIIKNDFWNLAWKADYQSHKQNISWPNQILSSGLKHSSWSNQHFHPVPNFEVAHGEGQARQLLFACSHQCISSNYLQSVSSVQQVREEGSKVVINISAWQEALVRSSFKLCSSHRFASASLLTLICFRSIFITALTMITFEYLFGLLPASYRNGHQQEWTNR